MAIDAPKTDTGGEQRIREKAYELWQADGAPEGNSDHYWHRACEILETEFDNSRSRA